MIILFYHTGAKCARSCQSCCTHPKCLFINQELLGSSRIEDMFVLGQQCQTGLIVALALF